MEKQLSQLPSSVPKKRWKAKKLYIVMIIVVLMVASVQVAAYYDFERQFLSNSNSSGASGNHKGSVGNSSSANSIEVYTLINFGNRTSRWFNDSNVPKNWNFYNLTVYLSHDTVQSKWYSDVQEHYVTGIYGIQEPTNASLYWGLWQFCNGDQAWFYAQVGVDEVHLSDQQILSWFFEPNTTPPIPPVSGAKTVSSAC